MSLVFQPFQADTVQQSAVITQEVALIVEEAAIGGHLQVIHHIMVFTGK